MGHIEKKRDVLSLVNNATIALSNMSASAAKLEYHDNDKVSRELKTAIVNFENNELKALKDAVKAIRAEINSRPTNKSDKRIVLLENLKQFKTNNINQ